MISIPPGGEVSSDTVAYTAGDSIPRACIITRIRFPGGDWITLDRPVDIAAGDSLAFHVEPHPLIETSHCLGWGWSDSHRGSDHE